jgi:agmatinase
MQPNAGTLFGVKATDTFLGLPSAAVAEFDWAVGIVGAPAATPYPSVGAYCAAAPMAIRAASAAYAATVAHMDFDLGGPIFPSDSVGAADLGDLAYEEAEPAKNRDQIRDTVRAIVEPARCRW